MISNNMAGMAGRILQPPQILGRLYGRTNLYRAYAAIERRSGIYDTVIIIFSADAIDMEGHEDGTPPAELLKENENVLFIGAAQTMRNTETGQIDTFIYCDYVSTGYAVPQNEICITGTIEREPTFRDTPKGRKITDITIRVKSAFEDSFYCLIPVIAWGKNAEEAAAMLRAGDVIEVSGRLQSRKYTKHYEDGHTEARETQEISAQHIIKK